MEISKRVEEYKTWHWLQRETEDIDPVYPVLKRLTQTWSPESRAWLVLLYVAYYHLGSALKAYEMFDHWELLPGLEAMPPTLLGLPCATERRGHRVRTRLAVHLDDLARNCLLAGGAANLLSIPDWTRLNERLLTIRGNGRWAAYKTAELAQKVCGVDLSITDAAHAYSSGPRKGLADVFGPVPTGNDPVTVAWLDRATDQLAKHLGESDIGYVETSLCDFHSLINGRYYLGHDIDQMQEQLTAVPSHLAPPAFAARRVLPAEYRGELHDWSGVQKARKSWYVTKGVIARRP